MNKNVRFMLFTLLVVVVGAGLCFGQINPRTKTEKAPAPVVTAPAPAPSAAMSDAVKFKPGLQFYVKKDGLQCILDHSGELGAAYSEADASGCKKVYVGQATNYNCGYHTASNPAYAKCLAAKAKIETILKNCGLTPPVHNPAPEGGWDMNPVTPGCNSLGISCMESPS